MFSKAQIGLVWWPVTLAQYDDAGELVETTIRVLFKPLTRAERNERQRAILMRTSDALRELRAEADITRPASDDASIERIGDDATARVLERIDAAFEATEEDVQLVIERTHDWRGPQDGDTPVPFSRELLADLMRGDLFAKPMLEAFSAASEGAVRKNSKPGPAGTPA